MVGLSCAQLCIGTSASRSPTNQVTQHVSLHTLHQRPKPVTHLQGSVYLVSFFMIPRVHGETTMAYHALTILICMVGIKGLAIS